MDVRNIVKLINAVPITEQTAITQLKHMEDDEPYQVWTIDTGTARYILKEAKEDEAETYRLILSELKDSCIPVVYQRISAGDKIYLLMEYADGENLCKCNRTKLTLTLDALISLQRKTWNNHSLATYGYSFEKSLRSREHRGKYLNDPLLEEAYERFMRMYHTVPRALCHDDLLPFNVIASDHRAVLIDWECGGILPYPTAFARLIAHGEDMEELYRTLGDKLKKVFKGFKAWVIGYNTDLLDTIGLKPSLKFPLLNGSLECELREYVIFDGTYAEFRKEGRSVKNEDFKGERRPQFKRRNFEPTDNKEKPRYNKWHKQDDEEGKGNSDKERPRRKPRFQADGSPKNALEEKIRRPYHKRRRDEDSRRKSADSGSKDQYSTTEDTERSQQRPTSEHSEARTNRIIKFKQPQLSADKEQPIIRGRRNSWRRNDLPENNENND